MEREVTSISHCVLFELFGLGMLLWLWVWLRFGLSGEGKENVMMSEVAE